LWNGGGGSWSRYTIGEVPRLGPRRSAGFGSQDWIQRLGWCEQHRDRSSLRLRKRCDHSGLPL